MKSCSRNDKKASRLLSFLLVITLTAGMFLTVRPQSNAVKGDYRELAGDILREGAVLLKNDGTLPLKPGNRISVFGSAQINALVGGGGSAVMFTDHSVTPLEGLRAGAKKKKFSLNEELAQKYEDYVGKRSELSAVWGNDAFKTDDSGKAYASEEMILDDETVRSAAAVSDVAVYILSRFSTEGDDLDPVKGGYYLSDAEDANVALITRYFSKTVVLLNYPCGLDTSWFGGKSPKYDISSAMMIWYIGEEGGNAITDLLTGAAVPSGKLTTTLPASYEDLLVSQNFDQKTNVYYEEDIFMGYRQFETFDPEYTKVNYEFGFGLSYTDFEISTVGCRVDNGNICLDVRVKNTGKVSGREVVQAYFSAPQGLLGKPGKELAAFAKTGLIAPGKAETLTLTFPVSDMSSFDDTGKVAACAFVLEAGTYRIFVGNSIKDAGSRGPVFEYSADSTVVTEQLTSKVAPTRLTRRLLADGSYGEVELRTRRITASVPGRANSFTGDSPRELTLIDVYNDESLWDEFLAGLSVEEMAKIAGGQPTVIPYAAGGIFGSVLAKYYCPSISCTDGGQGIRVMSLCTYFPSAHCLASSWNVELAESWGKAVGDEAYNSGIEIWLGPGANIIRNPLCGRNFEYMSEDPLLAGKIIAATVRGCQSQGVSACVKHYLANNKERNRGPSDSQISERAQREIYLRVYEITVKEAQPWFMMTTCGTVNGQGAAGNYHYIYSIPREEWGYEGCFMSDWANMDGEVEEMRAGHDLSMPEANYERLITSYEQGKTTRAQLEDNTYRLLSNLMKMKRFKLIADSEYDFKVAGSGRSVMLFADYYWGDHVHAVPEHCSDPAIARQLSGLSWNDWFFYRINVTRAGEYTLSTGFETLKAYTGEYTLYIDGEEAFTFKPEKATSDWYTPAEGGKVKIYLSEGTHELKAVVNDGEMNLVYLSFCSGYKTARDRIITALCICIPALAVIAASIIIVLRRKKKKDKAAEA